MSMGSTMNMGSMKGIKYIMKFDSRIPEICFRATIRQQEEEEEEEEEED